MLFTARFAKDAEFAEENFFIFCSAVKSIQTKTLLGVIVNSFFPFPGPNFPKNDQHL